MLCRRAALLLLLSVIRAPAARVNSNMRPIELTQENFEDKVAGKNAFVQFLAPWWGHCKQFKATWEKLGATFANRPDVIIGAADCTASGRSLCQSTGVYGYPTLKYFDTDGVHYYSGSRKYGDLKKFVEDNLLVHQRCLIDDPTGCSLQEKKYIRKMRFKDAYSRNKHIRRLEKLQGVQGDKLPPKVKEWSLQQLAILKQF